MTTNILLLGRQLQQDQFVFAEKFNEDSSNVVHSLHELVYCVCVCVCIADIYRIE